MPLACLKVRRDLLPKHPSCARLLLKSIAWGCQSVAAECCGTLWIVTASSLPLPPLPAGYFTYMIFLEGGGLPDVAELTGTFRLVSNMTRLQQEVPVPQRFIDGGFLSPALINRLQPSYR